jgi:EmrB/QacA subfamily drug resistance transporter
VATAYERRWLILAVVLAAECMDLLDATVVNVAAPAIHRDLHTSPTGLQWIVGGYALAIAVGLITGGRLGDLYGRRRMFLVGAAGFTAASVLCGIAPSTGWLIAFRLLQGLVAALMLPQGFGVIREVFPTDEIGQAFGIFGPVIGLAAVLGPIVGGALVDWNLAGTGWRLVFLVNLPLGLAATVGSWRLLPKTAPTHDAQLDVGGAVLSGVACLALVYPLIQGRELGWPWWTYVLMVLSVVLFAAFALQQRARARAGADPLVLPSVFSHRGYSGGLLVMLFFFSGMGGLLLTMSVFLQLGQGFSPIHAGIVFIPMSLGMAVGAGLSGAVLGKKFGRVVIQAGALVCAIGVIVVIATVRGDAIVGAVDLLPGLAIMGLGMGLAVAPLFDVVLASVSDEETGSASGLLNALQQLSGSIGVAVLGTIFFAAIGHGFGRHVVGIGLQRTLWVQVGALAMLLLISPLLPRYARESDAPGAVPAATAVLVATDEAAV